MMKTFGEIREGDEIYILRIENETGEIKYRTQKVKTRTTGQTTDVVTLIFNDQAVITESRKSWHKVEYRPAKREIMYFSDKLAVEEAIKARCDFLRDVIGNLENAYQELWKEPEKEVIPQFERGKFIHIDPFKTPGICDGQGGVYFNDGYALDIKEFKDAKITDAEQEEINEFFRICAKKMTNATDTTEKTRIHAALFKCGYSFNFFTKTFEKG